MITVPCVSFITHRLVKTSPGAKFGVFLNSSEQLPEQSSSLDLPASVNQ